MTKRVDLETGALVDTERPHEFFLGTGNLPENYCQFIKDTAGYCGQPREAAVHQVVNEHLYPHQQCKGRLWRDV